MCEFENTSNHFQELEQCNENVSLPGPTQACLHRYNTKASKFSTVFYISSFSNSALFFYSHMHGIGMDHVYHTIQLVVPLYVVGYIDLE